MPVRDLLIVGAGPSGLATAIAAKQNHLDFVIVEKGILVNSIFNFPTQMVFFTTPELLEIGALPLITPYDKPTRLEALRYYRRVVDSFGLQVAFHEEVVDIEREEEAPSPDNPAGQPVFAVTTKTPGGPACAMRAPSAWASAITTCPTTWECPERTSRTSRTTTPRRILTIATGSSSLAARTRRRKRHSSFFEPERR